MAAPIRKVAPNASIFGTVAKAVSEGEAALLAASSNTIHDSLSAFGVVVSSTAPQSLGRAAVARQQLRRTIGLR